MSNQRSHEDERRQNRAAKQREKRRSQREKKHQEDRMKFNTPQPLPGFRVMKLLV